MVGLEPVVAVQLDTNIPVDDSDDIDRKLQCDSSVTFYSCSIVLAADGVWLEGRRLKLSPAS